MECPSKDEFADCLLGRIASARAETLLEHAEHCDSCGQVVSQLDDAADGVTEALRNRTSTLSFAGECERMIDRAEVYVQSDHCDDTVTDMKQHLLQGTKVRDYEIIRPIGEGGMGAVFLARHGRLDRDVALKVLSLRRVGDVEAQKRFEQEMAIVGKLQHHGIVRALDAGEQDGVQYLVMEVIDGVDLHQLVELLGPIPLSDACEICRQAAEALDYAHGQQLIHRDVKPSNIMLDGNGTAKLMDLGLARFTDQRRSLTSTQQAMGSLDFMAPEQLRADDVDRRADIYGLACTFHFLLTGEPPEKRRTAALMVSRTPKLESLRSVLPPPLTRLIHQMLAVDPAKRVESAADVAEELAPFCNRADLKQLALNARNLVKTDVKKESGSITSEISAARQRQTSSFAYLVGVLGVAAVIALASWFAMPLLGPAGGLTPVALVELNRLPSISSSVQPNREIPLFQVHQQAIRCVAFADKTSYLICGSDDATISIRDLPNQRKITVLCQFDAPICQISLAADQLRFALVDESGSMALATVVAPPEGGNLLWTLPPDAFPSKPVDVMFLPENDRLVIRHEDGTIRLFDANQRKSLASTNEAQLANGMRLAPNGRSVLLVGDNGTVQPLTLPQLTAQRPQPDPNRQVTAQVNGKPVSLFARIESRICAIDGSLARLISPNDLQSQHFIYAEHSHPITVVHPFPDESLVLTGDRLGEIRLWHVPGQPHSDMLMACDVSIESQKMTFAIHRQKKWSLAEFENPDPDHVTYAEASGEITITTSINRDGRRHVLEYKIDPMATNDE